MGTNRLNQETSPYLLQHRDNPVHWWAWGPDAFAEAKATGKPVLLSVGYAACHWCHVMAHESFENAKIADLMNDLFINIKVDREERPDLDTLYQQALSLLGQQGGWPLTMFLTADRQPFWGGTYFPPESRWGRPGFPDVLVSVSRTYADDPEKVLRNVAALTDALQRLTQSKPGGLLDATAFDQVATRLLREVDPFHGGIGDAPKFPQCALFELLWRAFQRTGEVLYSTAVINTLTHMCQGGIYDHLGGGFARYSTDAEWLVPHFEKMLYDNALMVGLMTLVWQSTENPLFAARIRETIAWLSREMIAENGAFAATLDADSEGEEGLFYVWQADEVARVLGDDTRVFASVYNVTSAGNWEGKTILNRSKQLGAFDPATEPSLALLRAKLLQVRDRRVRPGWDDKVLADWNGLAIANLAHAGAVFDEPGWIAMARQAFDAVIQTMTLDHRLMHCWRAGQVKHRGTLEDYANMARAALALFQASGDWTLVNRAVAWANDCQSLFHDSKGGGYFTVAEDASDLIVRPRSAHDAAVPNGNGTLLEVMARLWFITGDQLWRDRAESTIRAFSGELARNFFPLATWINAAELLLHGVQVVIVGDPAHDATQALRRAAYRKGLANLVLIPLHPTNILPAGHPAMGKGMVDGQPTAYVCRDFTCAPPVTDPIDLAALL